MARLLPGFSSKPQSNLFVVGLLWLRLEVEIETNKQTFAMILFSKKHNHNFTERCCRGRNPTGCSGRNPTKFDRVSVSGQCHMFSPIFGQVLEVSLRPGVVQMMCKRVLCWVTVEYPFQPPPYWASHGADSTETSILVEHDWPDSTVRNAIWRRLEGVLNAPSVTQHTTLLHITTGLNACQFSWPHHL